MRVILGIILGVAFTIGGAYIYDHRHAPTGGQAALNQRTVVNWDVASTKWDHLTVRARNEWTKIAGR
ncbi:MAG TPA: hypothetical protein VFB45_06200 [Pseudolabrys sp.]|nr:hypothetical protein [Pseudolabrys sp.]